MLWLMRFPGGKGRLYQKLISLMPPHRVYIEAFAGGGAILRHKRPAKRNIALERDFSTLIQLRAKCSPGALLICADAFSFLSNYAFRGDELVYCDPPYLPSSRRRRRVYRLDLSEERHADLLQLIVNLPCMVMISGYPSALYAERLGDWEHECFQVRTHSSWTTESIWCNFNKPDVLHDGRFLGGNFRERHTIRRRLERTRKRLKALSTSEKGELLAWLSRELEESRSWIKR